MTIRLILVLACCSIALAGCGDPADESTPPNDELSDADRATATLSSMLEVAAAGDWGAYVDRYYGEQHKFTSADDRDAVVKRFEEKWGAKVVEALRRAVGLTPRIDGDKAMFEDDEGPVFVLHRGDDGTWTFHL